MWEELPPYKKWGTLCYKVMDDEDGREVWTEDLHAPLLFGVDRNIVDRSIVFSEEG